MAQNIVLQGATYSAVPSVNLPKQGGGTASFVDVTDTTATAADVSNTKYFYTSAGVRTQGTNTGITPTGNINITSSGSTDVKNYATATVPAVQLKGMLTPTVQSHTISVDSNGEITAEVVIYDEETPVYQNGFATTSDTVAMYNQSGQAYQLDTQAAKTVTPTTSPQTAVAAGKYTTGAVTVAAMPTGTAGTPTATKGAVSNHSVSVTPSVTNTTGYITGSTKTGTAVTVSASELVSGDKSITANGNNIDVANYSTVSVNVSGGGGGMTVATATATPVSASSSISFTGLGGEPTSFYVVSAADLATGASPYKTAAVVYDGTDVIGQTITNTNNAQVSYDDTNFSYTYNSGTLTITGSTYFQANQYKLVYTYGGSSANIGTDDVQVGSGATSITFTGLSEEPSCFSCIFKSNFATSTGYTRTIVVVYDGTNTYGMEMGSGALATSNWSYTYNSGSLTISSQSTSAGGYFHQPGYYQLTYGIGGEINIDVEPLTVTQNGVYAESGKAYSPVTVNVSGGGGVNVDVTTWTNSSTSTVSHQFTSLKGTPKAAFLRCTSQLTRSSSNTYYYIADIVWDGTDVNGNYHLRSNGSYTNVPSTGTAKYNVTVGTNSITFSSTATSRSSAPGSFYNGTYELVYVY